jgi:transposase
MSQPPSFTRLLPTGLRTVHMTADREGLVLLVKSEASRARCPVCGSPSERIHSRYTRSALDLPWRAIAVKLKVRARKFFCDERSCERHIFCERLLEIAAGARKTDRLQEVLRAIALRLGGEAGARLARELGLAVSPDALLDRLRKEPASPRSEEQEVRAVGIDDWSFRRGHRYGTILVDLERHEVIDLLEDREAESVTDWLKRHPKVEVIARDRSGAYAEAASKGAPQAMQVADRWHLMHNLAGALEEFLLQKGTALREAARTETQSPEEEDDAASVLPGPLTPHRPRIWYERQLEASRKRHERLVEQWRNIRRLHLAGADVYDIARRLGVSRSTVYRYREREEPPKQTRFRHKRRVLDPYVPYILKRWQEGCRNSRKLYQEIRERGYAHDISNLGRLLSELRRAEAGRATGRPPPGAVHPDAPIVPTARQAAALFLRRKEKLTTEQQEYLYRLQAQDEVVAGAYRLTQQFAKMVRELEGERLEEWLEEAKGCRVLAVRRFANGLEKDFSAVHAGLTENWSNGPVEGFIHKLKLLKRQGYGRAGFDLLRARMLAA